jgi:hypothetical protein
MQPPPGAEHDRHVQRRRDAATAEQLPAGPASGRDQQPGRVSNNWPGQGSGQVKVVSFSWWILKDYANGGKVVDAVYVGPAQTDPTLGNTLPPAYIPQLTG